MMKICVTVCILSIILMGVAPYVVEKFDAGGISGLVFCDSGLLFDSHVMLDEDTGRTEVQFMKFSHNLSSIVFDTEKFSREFYALKKNSCMYVDSGEMKNSNSTWCFKPSIATRTDIIPENVLQNCQGFEIVKLQASPCELQEERRFRRSGNCGSSCCCCCCCTCCKCCGGNNN